MARVSQPTHTLIRLLPDGSVRSIYSDTVDYRLFGPDETRQRASSVESVPAGPQRGNWFVDFSALGPGYELCLLQTYRKRAEALAAEVAWLRQNWL
jgi:hypothetical protein